MKTVFEVETTNINVDDTYFSFNYKILRNGKEVNNDEYSSDHSWSNDKKTFKQLLKNSYAAELALEQL